MSTARGRTNVIGRHFSLSYTRTNMEHALSEESPHACSRSPIAARSGSCADRAFNCHLVRAQKALGCFSRNRERILRGPIGCRPDFATKPPSCPQDRRIVSDEHPAGPSLRGLRKSCHRSGSPGNRLSGASIRDLLPSIPPRRAAAIRSHYPARP